ncbi:MAG: cysteine methyltransferase, partial [Gemmatimonadetes bacterium]|nr:cysteine methyltransferase [Gemmatimonadota bacterium]
PHGRASSYGGVAALLGQPRAARGAGQALHALPDDSDVPWWRVVNRHGEISIRGVLHGAVRQRQLLRSEGVRFGRDGRIDWRRFGWVPEDPEGSAPEAFPLPPTEAAAPTRRRR